MTLADWIRIGGLLHLPILAAALAVPRMLDWRTKLGALDPFLRRLFWVYGCFVATTILAFAAGGILLASELADGALGRACCGFVAAFWWLRIVVQIAVFDARPVLTTPLHRVGYHALSVLFAAVAAIFTIAAWRP